MWVLNDSILKYTFLKQQLYNQIILCRASHNHNDTGFEILLLNINPWFSHVKLFLKAILRNYLYFCNNVDHNGDYCRTTAAGAFRTNTWCRIEIEQKFEGYQVLKNISKKLISIKLMEFIFSGGTLSKLQELEQWPMSLIQNPENGTMLLFMQVALFILLRMPKSEIWTTSLPLHLLLYHEKNRLDISVFIFWLHGLLLRHFLLQQHTLGPAITRCPRKDFKMGDPPLFVDLHLTQLFEHGQLWQIQ